MRIKLWLGALAVGGVCSAIVGFGAGMLLKSVILGTLMTGVTLPIIAFFFREKGEMPKDSWIPAMPFAVFLSVVVVNAVLSAGWLLAFISVGLGWSGSLLVAVILNSEDFRKDRS